MVSYLGDLMEDATDFSWQGAKAAHAVLLCEMEQGSLQWEDLDCIDRIRRAHAQKHVSGRSGWGNPRITQARRHGTAKIIKLGIVVTHVTMNLMEKFKNTSVQTVWLGAGRWGIQKGNVHTKKHNLKTNKQLPITRVQQLQ